MMFHYTRRVQTLCRFRARTRESSDCMSYAPKETVVGVCGSCTRRPGMSHSHTLGGTESLAAGGKESSFRDLMVSSSAGVFIADWVLDNEGSVRARGGSSPL